MTTSGHHAANLICDRCRALSYSASPQVFADRADCTCGGTLRLRRGYHDGTRLGPGVYAHAGEMHVDAGELADAVGVPRDHPRRDELVERAVRRVCGDAIPVEVE